VVCGSVGGALVAGAAAVLVRALLEGLFGLHLVNVGGAVDGLVLGAAVGLGYGITASPPGGGLAAPRGTQRVITVVTVGLCCAIGGAALTVAGRPLIGGLVHEIARSSRDADLVLAPLGRAIGEPGFGPITRMMLSAFESTTFGTALAWGLTRRPSAR